MTFLTRRKIIISAMSVSAGLCDKLANARRYIISPENNADIVLTEHDLYLLIVSGIKSFRGVRLNSIKYPYIHAQGIDLDVGLPRTVIFGVAISAKVYLRSLLP
jgi:hypothetical protein